MEDEFAYLKHARITDFEQINALSKTTDTTIVQLDDGAFCSDIVKFKAGGVLVSQTTSNRHLRVFGKAQYFNVTYVDCPRNQATWNGTAVGKNQLVVVKANEEFDLIAPPRTTTMCVALVAEAHASLLAQGSRSTQERIRGTEHSISCRPAALREFDGWLISVLDRLIKNGSIAEEAVALEQEVVRKLLHCIAAPIETDWGKEPTDLRRSAVAKIQKHIVETGNAPESINELCVIGEVSRRTLEYAFKEIFSCSPRQFLKAQKLNATRMDLLLAKQQDSNVATIAKVHGFSHMGQFASDYQRRFGEQPRQTLARSGSTAELQEQFADYSN